MSVLSSFMRNVTSPNKLQSNQYNAHSMSPMLNELNINLRSFFNQKSQIGKKKKLMDWVKNTLELKNLVSKVSRDMTGKFHFEQINPSASGRNNILRANRFAAEVQYKRNKFEQNFDKLATGECFGWKGFISDNQLKDAITKSIGNRPFMEMKEIKQLSNEIFNEIKATQGFSNINGIDEDLLRPRKYRTIASSSMEILYDKNDILGYVQDVGGTKINYSTKEIIRQTLEDIDGKVNGFTSVESAIVQLELLRFMWGNLISYEKNGGTMDNIFILEDTQVNSESYRRIKQQLQKYKLVENKHGSMVFTGKIKVEHLEQLDKMQFKDMGIYITSLLAKMWNVPNSQGSVSISESNTKDDTGGNSEKAYWEMIEFYQERDAEIDNIQLWIPHFGVKIVYDKQYVQKDVQEETAKQLKLNNIKIIDELAGNNNKRLRFEDKMKLLNLDKEMFEDIPEGENPLRIMKDDITGTANQLSKNNVNDTQEKSDLRKKKKSEQETTQGKGINTGTGKQWDSNAELEYKQIIGSDDEILPLKDFVKIYNSDRALNPGMSPRLFRRENYNFITYKFKSTDFVFKTIIDKSMEEDNRVLIMNLGGNIYNL